MKFLTLLLSFATILSVSAQTPDVNDFVASATQRGTEPVDYIFRLFEQSDIVVIGERDHRDTTQYELILDILGDPRFAERVGYVYTEVGCVNRTDDVNRLIKNHSLSDDEFNEELYSYLRKGEVFYTLWEKYNRVQFLKGLHKINRDGRRKITLGLTDCDFAWEDVDSAQEYLDIYNGPACDYRDSTMAANFAKMYAKQRSLKGKRKALIITNQPHATNAAFAKRDYLRQGRWLKNLFGEQRVKIVMLNWAEYRLFDGRRMPLVADGKWDAAFEMLGCNPFGMDIQDTPYGATPYADPAYGNLLWQEIADGIIYYKPYYETVLAAGVRGIVDKEFEEEFMRRTNIFYEAMGLPKTSLSDAKSSYDGFTAVEGTFPQKVEEVKAQIRSLIPDK